MRKLSANEMNGVVITVYEESPASGVRPLSDSNPDKKVKKTKTSHGNYDRRAQLLAQTQELRKADNEKDDQQFQWKQESKSSRQKSKKKWKCSRSRENGLTGTSFLGIFRKTKLKYRRMESDSEEDDKRKTTTTGTGNHGKTKFWRKLKRMFRGISSVCKRKKG